MRTHHIFFIIFVCTLFFIPGTSFSESNFDFFFKDASRYKDVVVKTILSTDTILLEEGVGERPEAIRLIGLKGLRAPEKKDTDKIRDQYGFTIKETVNPLTPIEERAFEFTKELLEGQHVRLEFDTNKKGDNHTTLAYVFLLKDNTLVNTEILRQGFAQLRIRPPNTKYAKELREAYREGRAEKRGLQGE